MTIEEAKQGMIKEIEILNQMIIDYQIIGQEELSVVSDMRNRIKTYELAIEALEKQIPKKPFQDKDIYGTKYLLCRECSKILSFVGFVARYCPDCGQKIDWN